jgi:hypothetical protein
MQVAGRLKITPMTLQRLLNAASDPRRLGGPSRAFGIVRRHPLAEEYMAFWRQNLESYQDLHDFFSSMLEEEAVRLLDTLEGRMPDTSRDTVHETVRRLSKVA